MPKDKDLFGIDNSIPTLDSIADNKITPDDFLPEIEDEPHFLDRDMPCFDAPKDVIAPNQTAIKLDENKIDLYAIEQIIEPIVSRKVQLFTAELSRVLVQEVMDAIENEINS